MSRTQPDFIAPGGNKIHESEVSPSDRRFRLPLNNRRARRPIGRDDAKIYRRRLTSPVHGAGSIRFRHVRRDIFGNRRARRAEGPHQQGIINVADLNGDDHVRRLVLLRRQTRRLSRGERDSFRRFGSKLWKQIGTN